MPELTDLSASPSGARPATSHTAEAGAAFLQGSVPAPPKPGLAVACHIADGRDRYQYSFELNDSIPNNLYHASVWVYIPASFVAGQVVVVFRGYAAESFTAADVNRKGVWQKLEVVSRVPATSKGTVPTLEIMTPTPGVVYSSGWTMTLLENPDSIDTDTASAKPGREYTIIPLRDLLAMRLTTSTGEPRVASAFGLPDGLVKIPPVSFGATVCPPEVTAEFPAGAWNQPDYQVPNPDLYSFRDAVVHGEQGIISLDHWIVEETLFNAFPAFIGFEQRSERTLWLDDADAEPAVHVGAAAHAMYGYVGNRNYCHWWMGVVPAFLVPPLGVAFRDKTLLLPKLRHSWQTETLALLPEVEKVALAVGERTRVHCSQLDYLPGINRSDWTPHPFRRSILDLVKDRVGNTNGPRRRIYITRRDSPLRKLLNEEDVIALLANYGFEPITPGDWSVAEQIRLFASASHVMGAHGAGLGNVIFCQLGSTLCELQMNSNVQWSIRRAAAISQMNYGCIVGRDLNGHPDTNQRIWEVNLETINQCVREMVAEK